MPNPNVDWTKAPDETAAWHFNAKTGPEWLTVTHLHAHFIHDPIEKCVTLGPHGPAPLFGWVGGPDGSLTRKMPYL